MTTTREKIKTLEVGQRWNLDFCDLYELRGSGEIINISEHFITVKDRDFLVKFNKNTIVDIEDDEEYGPRTIVI